MVTIGPCCTGRALFVLGPLRWLSMACRYTGFHSREEDKDALYCHMYYQCTIVELTLKRGGKDISTK